MEKYELQGRECLTIQAILKNQTQQCFSVSIIPKIFERKVREYPSLAPMKTKHRTDRHLGIKNGNPQSFMLNKYLKI